MKNWFLLLVFIPMISFSQKDSIRVIDQFYLELNGGPGLYDSGVKNIYRDLSINLNSKVFYKNHRYRAGMTFGCLYVWSEGICPSFSIESSINILAKTDFPHYFGPCLGYGYFLMDENNYSLGDRFIEFGIEYYYKKFHVSFNNQFIAFENQKFNNNTYNKTFNIHMEIGYAFNLDSFRKKKK